MKTFIPTKEQIQKLDEAIAYVYHFKEILLSYRNGIVPEDISIQKIDYDFNSKLSMIKISIRAFLQWSLYRTYPEESFSSEDELIHYREYCYDKMLKEEDVFSFYMSGVKKGTYRYRQIETKVLSSVYQDFSESENIYERWVGEHKPWGIEDFLHIDSIEEFEKKLPERKDVEDEYKS